MRFLLLILPLLCMWGHVLAPLAAHVISRIGYAAALPSYHLRLSDGQTEAASDEGAVLRLDRDATIEILIQPDEYVEDETCVDAFLVQGGRVTPWPINLQRATSGAFHLRTPVREMPGLGAGRSDILLRVGRPRAMLDPSLGALTNPDRFRLLWGHLDISGNSM